ncbi:MAG: signal recognition particle protein [Chlamydiales bacterium]|nr:signal recognition particle protein [Chlamydiales bacterium]
MFDTLSDKFQGIFSSFSSKKKISEENLVDAIRQVRLALLEADVSYSVVKNFIKIVKQKAVGETVLKAVSPQQQFIKIVHDELVSLLGNDEPELNLDADTSNIMVCGLQGSGKTTFCGKLAKWLQKKGKNKILLVACDLQRPAAVEQLGILAEKTQVDFFRLEGEQNPVEVAKHAMKKSGDYDVVIFDTAGRLQVDEELMQELKSLKQTIQPKHTLFVANAQTGQEAVNVASKFHEQVDVSGHVLTMLDGDARAGAALSILEVTKRPLIFEGIGEKLGDLQEFNPRSLADRVLGMGDTVNLVKKAQEVIDEKDAKGLEEKIRNASFTYDDYLKQIQMVKKMGSLKSILKMIPGANKLPLDQVSDKEIRKIEALILSMTPDERVEKVELSHSRKKRVASGSGCEIMDINKLVKSFKQARKLFKNLPNKKQMLKAFGG